MSSQDDLAVSLAGLSDLATELRALKKRMDGATRADRGLRHGELGPGPVEGALESFLAGWKDGRAEIGAGLESAADMATAIVEELTRCDRELAEKVRGQDTGSGRA